MKLPAVRSFESKESPVLFPSNADPIERFFAGDASTRWSTIVHHPQVEGFVYMNGTQVMVAYLLRIVMHYDKLGQAQQTIGAVTGDMDDFFHSHRSKLCTHRERISLRQHKRSEQRN